MDIEKLNNSKVNLFGDVYTIHIVDNIIDDVGDEILGLTDPVDMTIQVARTCRKIKVSKDQMNIAFLHELSHAILDAGGYCDLSSQEPFVEWLGKCMNACINQEIFK